MPSPKTRASSQANRQPALQCAAVSDDLDRFIRAQDSPQSGLAAALDELRGDGKRTHWIWYVFPQLRGLGNSWNSEFYGIDGVEEAVAYLTHPVLRRRLLQATGIVAERASLPDRDVVELRELSRLANEVLTRASEQGYSPCRLTIDVLERADA